ncbi:MAG: glycosyltransferase [Patescibacteria group bacterium]
MKVLMVSLDRKAFIEGDPARLRLASYGQVFSELHIVVYAERKLGLSEEQIAENVWLYPTDSASKLSYIGDALRIGKRVGKGCDIVSGQDLGETGLAASLIARSLKIPLQLQDHADVFDPWFAREGLGNRLRVMLARFLLPQADCLRVVLPRMKTRLLERYPRLRAHIEVLPVYTPVEAFRQALTSFSLKERYPQFSHISLMASRLVPQKDIALALRAFEEADVPGSGLVIVGEGQLRPALEAEALRLGLSERVIFVSWENDLVSYYKTADLFLLSSRYESYCRTLVEAAACGLPFVATDVGVASALVDSGAQGSVVPVNDSKAFANAIRDWSAKAGEATTPSAGLFAIEKLVGKDAAAYRERYRATLSACVKAS